MQRRIAAIALGLAASSAAHAVYLNPRGLGQVLVYPYYTTNAGQATLFTVVNTTPNGKALKMRFHEGYNGRDVLIFNVYLSPYDVWAAEIAQSQSGADAPATIQKSDTSCTVPQFTSADFRTFAYTGANIDTGPTSGARTREGHFDVIEMGEVTNAAHGSLDALTHVDGVPADCSQLVNAWTVGGYWTADPTADLAPPGGGLYGSESIIDVAQGTIYTINAEAIDGFSATIQHSQPGANTPDLNTANDGADTNTVVTAFVPIAGKMLQLTYDYPVDAVSALFMASPLYNEYDIEPSIGAQSDWLVTFPTKRFYVDPEIVGPTALSPFDEGFGSAVAGESCAPFSPLIFDREEATVVSGFPEPPVGPGFGFCFESSVLTFNQSASVLGSQLLAGDASRIRSPFGTDDIPFTSGHLLVDLLSPTHSLTSSNGYVLVGLPAFGFLARSYINANVTAGVLANYSGLLPHRASLTCLKANSSAACP